MKYTLYLMISLFLFGCGDITPAKLPLNSAPIARAGLAQTVPIGTNVLLNGSFSTDVDGNALSYRWVFITKPAGSTVVLINPTGVNPDFSVDVAGEYIVQLIVNDGLLDSTPATVTISTQNSAPVARAGFAQTRMLQESVQLDGNASSDVDGNTLSYTWTLSSVPVGSNASLFNANSVAPSFLIDMAGQYNAQLMVNDGLLNSTLDTVVISTQNSAPVAESGAAQTVALGNSVTLDGSGSADVDGNVLTYRWALITRPVASNASLSGNNRFNSSFTADVAGEYVAQLIVSDGLLDSAPATVAISTRNTAPVADAGPDQSKLLQNIVLLDGSASRDVDADSLSYHWSLISAPVGSNAVLTGANTVSPSFTIDQPGQFIVQLTVNDGVLNSVQDNVVISTTNSAPIAVIGAAQSVASGVQITLGGGSSSDVDGDALSFYWAMLMQPVGSNAQLSSSTIVAPSFNADLPGSYIAQLIVNDGQVASKPVTIVVTATSVMLDSDADGLPDNIELILGTDPHNPDSDGDGLKDGAEVNAYGTDPLNPDSDGDTLNDGAEVNTYNTDPTKADTDADGFNDNVEINGASNPLDPASVPAGAIPMLKHIAPGNAPTVATQFNTSINFIYSGASPVQTGVAVGTIDMNRVSVMRGQVFNDTSTPLLDVIITVLGHPEYGQTKTRIDGWFDIAVNGGSTLIVNYEKAGYLPVQRQVQAPWLAYSFADDVIMIPLDQNVTTVDLTAATPMQPARGGIVTDADGNRQATLLFAQGTTATMTLPDGTTQPLTTLNVRSTEYTVGAKGHERMPAALPATSGYTYAVELSVDEAMTAGATQVNFNQPVYFYLENFLGFPDGGIVPAGYYDRQQGRWIPSDNGLIIRIVSITAGMADVDINGDGVVDTGAALTGINMSNAERTQLASLYAAGASLWRVPVMHFSPWDYNWMSVPPLSAIVTNTPYPTGPNVPNKPCVTLGSIIGCETQTLGEKLPIVGTYFSLRYQSDLLPGSSSLRAMQIPLVGSTALPGTVKSIELELWIAGKRIKRSFTPAQALAGFHYVWDGLDAYQRPWRGLADIEVYIGYTYDSVYRTPENVAATFARLGTGVEITGVARRAPNAPITVWGERRTLRLGKAGTGTQQGFGGWQLDELHSYDPVTGVVSSGTGRSRNLNATKTIYAKSDMPSVQVSVVAGTGIDSYAGDASGTAKNMPIKANGAMTIGPDGSLYFIERPSFHNSVGKVVRRVDPQGVMSTVAGAGDARCGGRFNPPCPATGFPSLATPGPFPATSKRFNDLADLVVFASRAQASEANKLMLDKGGNKVVFEDFDYVNVQDGVSGTATYDLIVAAGLNSPSEISLSPDMQRLYVLDKLNYCVRSYSLQRQQSPDNRMVATEQAVMFGTCTATRPGLIPPGSPFPAGVPEHMDIDGAGNLYILEQGSVYRVTPLGVLTHIAGTAWDRIGITGVSNRTDGFLALDTYFELAKGITVSKNGRVFITEATRIRSFFPGGFVQLVMGESFLPTRQGNTSIRPTLLPGEDPILTLVNAQPLAGNMALGKQGSLFIYQNAPSTQSNVPGASSQDGYMIRKFQFSNAALLSPASERLIPDSNSQQVFVFDLEGRHLRTLDGLNGGTLLSFVYDAQNLLIAMDDGDGNRTQIVRDANGTATAIVAPGGQTTSLLMGTDGFLSSFSNPAGERTQFTYQAGGLLTRLTRPAGGISTFTYDTEGRLILDSNSEGGSTMLARTELSNGYSVLKTRASGITETYTYETLSTGDVQRSYINPAGGTRVVLKQRNGVTKITEVDGTVITKTSGPDPVWGALKNVLIEQTTVLPSGFRHTFNIASQAQLSNSTNPLSLLSTTTTLTENARTVVQHYDALTRTLTETSAEGRVRQSTYDSLGRVLRYHYDATQNDMVFAYNAAGQLATITKGLSVRTHAYDAQYRRIATTNGLNQITAFTYDLANRVTSITRPSGAVIGLQYDADGRRTGAFMPNGEQHHSVGINTYKPPLPAIPLQYSYDLDGLRKGSTAGSSTNTILRNTFGNLAQFNDALGAESYTYPALDGGNRITNQVYTPVNGIAQSIALAFDGSIITQIDFSGAATGTITRTLNPDGQLAQVQLNSGADVVTTALTWDLDKQLASIAGFTIDRTGPDRLPISMGDGIGIMQYVFDANQRLSSQALNVNASAVYSGTLQYDVLGRITQRSETVGNVVSVKTYNYNNNGQLVSVQGGTGNFLEQYSYDVNSNLISNTLSATRNTQYDAVDRIASSNGVAYAYDARGFLTSRGTDRFVYDTLGRLLSATVAGQSVQYAYDTLRRRTGRTDASGSTEYIYADLANAFQLTHVRGTDGVLVALHYDATNKLIAFDRGTGATAKRYYVGTDTIGSPRVITDSAGNIVKEQRFSAFGELLFDSNPAFSSVLGYAGGLPDQLTGLVRFGFRDYEPATAHWLGRDPLLFGSHQSNLYAYSHNDPINLRDPSGLFGIGWAVIGGIGAAGGISYTPSDGIVFCDGYGVGTDVGISATTGSFTPGTTTTAGAYVGVEEIASVGVSAEQGQDGSFSVTASGGLGPVGLDVAVDNDGCITKDLTVGIGIPFGASNIKMRCRTPSQIESDILQGVSDVGGFLSTIGSFFMPRR